MRYRPKHKKQNKPHFSVWIMRIAATLGCLTIISAYLLSGVYAKFSTTASGSDSARVAKWDIQINAKPSQGLTFSGKMDAEMKESLSYGFSVSSNSEVSAKYYITVEFSGKLDSTVDLYIGGIPGTPNDDRTVFTFAGDWTFAPGSHSQEHTLTLTRTYFQNGQMLKNFDDVWASISVIAEQIN